MPGPCVFQTQDFLQCDDSVSRLAFRILDFRDRCEEATDACLQPPPVWEAGEGRFSRCVLPVEGGRIRDDIVPDAGVDEPAPGEDPT